MIAIFMSEISPTEASPAFPGFKPALWLGGSLLAVLTLVIFLAVRDNSQRDQLEAIVQFNAVGDTHYAAIPPGPPAPPYPAIVILHGEPLYPVSYRKHEKREAELVPVARDEASGLNIYQTAPRGKDDADKDSGPAYFVKVGPGEFLKVHPIPPPQQ